MNTDAESAERALAKTYDSIPYAGQPFCVTHPGLLAAYGLLYGLSPSPPQNSRILEMGCGDCGNIVPLAFEFPESEFMGIDLSPVQIGTGQLHVESLGLTNIRLEARSIMDLGPTDGKFDYIIVHGVYSWVPDSVKEKILDVCRSNLKDQGIAYISYNVLPGWQFNHSMRDMMLYRTRHLHDPNERTQAALELVTTMLDTKGESDNLHDVQLRFFGKTLRSMDNVSTYLLHEYLEADNDPFYFHQFAGALKQKDLQYICDAEQSDFELDKLPADAATRIEKLSDNEIDIEQYLDFYTHTRFRHSLVCHDGIHINSDYRLERLEPLCAATGVVPVLDSPESSVEEVTAFRTMGGRQFKTQHVIAQAVLRILSGNKPCTMDIPSLIQAVKDELSTGEEADASPQAEKIGFVIYSLFFNGVVELLSAPRRCVLETGAYPLASPVARLLAPSGRVTNLCHRTIVMDDKTAGFVLTLLDGTLTRDGLIDGVMEGMRTGRLDHPGNKSGTVTVSRDEIGRQVDSIIQHLSRCGVMMNG